MGEKETYFHRHTFAVVWLLRSKEKRETERPHVETKRPTARGKRDLQYEANETYIKTTATQHRDKGHLLRPTT